MLPTDRPRDVANDPPSESVQTRGAMCRISGPGSRLASVRREECRDHPGPVWTPSYLDPTGERKAASPGLPDACINVRAECANYLSIEGDEPCVAILHELAGAPPSLPAAKQPHRGDRIRAVAQAARQSYGQCPSARPPSSAEAGTSQRGSAAPQPTTSVAQTRCQLVGEAASSVGAGSCRYKWCNGRHGVRTQSG